MTADISEFSAELNDYVCQRYGYKKRVCQIMNGTIGVFRVKVELYLRFKPIGDIFNANSLVVARIGFREQQRGEGTSLLKFFIEVAGRYNIENIAFEEVGTDLCRNFTDKWGFEKIYNDKQRTITVETLRKNLDATL